MRSYRGNKGIRRYVFYCGGYSMFGEVFFLFLFIIALGVYGGFVFFCLVVRVGEGGVEYCVFWL